jgi:beta-galactosidase
VDDLEINYSITGGAEIAGIANGNPRDISSFQQNHKKVFQGRGLVIIRPTIGQNKIIVRANAQSLKEGLIEILTTK